MLIIDHEGMFITIWKLLDIGICLSYSWISVYLAAFTFDDRNYNSIIENLGIYLEVFFLLTMIFEFLTDFKKAGEHEHEKDVKIIMKRYLKSNFLMDFIPLIPLP